MKKIFFLLGLFIILVNLSGCDNFILLSAEQSQKNFIKYRSSIEKVLNTHGYQMKEIFDSNYEDDSESVIREYEVKISDSSRIEIRLQHSDGREGFILEYISGIPNLESMNKNINVSLFVELVNVVSGKQITEKYCKEFLEATEDKYSANKHNSSKRSDELIKKMKYHGFFQNWGLHYILDDDFEESFEFAGLTKQLED